MTFEDKEYIKGMLGGLGYKQTETESMMNDLHTEEWWSHNSKSDDNYDN